MALGFEIPFLGNVWSIFDWGFSQFGKGRKEADIIVPVQDRLTKEFLNPTSQLTGVGWGGDFTPKYGGKPNPTLTKQDLYQIRDAAQNVISQWLGFLRSSEFTDGRASQQAANDLMPFLNGTAGYGLFAQGGGAPVSIHPNFSWSPPIHGGIIAGLNRAIQMTPATDLTSTIPGPDISPILSPNLNIPGGEERDGISFLPSTPLDMGIIPGAGPEILPDENGFIPEDEREIMQAGPGIIDTQSGLFMIGLVGVAAWLMYQKGK